MEQILLYGMDVLRMGGMLAPLIFIMIHLARPLLFLPVVFVCMSGGILFGMVAGSIYSFIGMTLSSLFFYQMAKWMPKSFAKLLKIKAKLLGRHSRLTVPQIACLRLIPFMHFHLLSLCLFEASADFKDYAKKCLMTNLPVAVVYTTLGEWISRLPLIYGVLFLILLVPLLYLLRKKQTLIKWQEFFQPGTS